MKKPEKSILLIGMMGAGKSTLGKLLADRLGRDFHDLDRVVENRAGKPVPKIFQNKGEEAFRALERELLAELLKAPPAVIAAGGGVGPKKEALNVWLTAPPEVLFERSRGGHKRPKRKGFKDFCRLLEKRRGTYEKAEIQVDNTGPEPYQAVEEILERLKNY